jgi:hypothetical protein
MVAGSWKPGKKATKLLLALPKCIAESRLELWLFRLMAVYTPAWGTLEEDWTRQTS